MTVDDPMSSQPKSVSLAGILDADVDEEIDIPESQHEKAAGWDEAEGLSAKEGYCIECEDQPAQLRCENCEDVYCEVCYAAQHRKGTRKAHKSTPLKGAQSSKPSSSKQQAHNASVASSSNGTVSKTTSDDDSSSDNAMEDDENHVPQSGPITGAQPALGSSVGDWFVERSKFIPMRLTLSERKYLRLLEAALQVSEYTDKIDVIGFGMAKNKRIVHQIRELCAILSGLVLSADYKQGQELFTDRDFEANAEFYQKIFEIGRRYKIMNPDKMRSTYGKLIYLLQDSQIPEVKNLLNFSCTRPIETVHLILEEAGALDLLTDDLITFATMEIYSEGRSRREIEKDIKKKENAIEVLAKRYARKDLPQETVRQCLYSIGDNHAFLRVNRDPCEKMIGYLKEYFPATNPKDKKHSLAIQSGKGGARLSHDHARQYSYVLQSLTLWREILHDMFHLWSLAEQDLLSPDISYRLRDTGQGLNRVQAAPKTSRMMHAILHRAQKSIGNWVGSSVIHMGDHNVPNALMFIDKYSQIYRILLPICNTLSQIPNLMAKPALRSYIEDDFGSQENLYREILGDFFRHAFDGSGADNFFDAGSCIDGRLTSAWNWCGNLEKKRYFPVFLLTGFIGFDGAW